MWMAAKEAEAAHDASMSRHASTKAKADAAIAAAAAKGLGWQRTEANFKADRAAEVQAALTLRMQFT